MGGLSFLAPIYVAAGLTVGLPILFHLIRRTPKGRQDFSSVMFLSPSPPRITRRSKIENWLLLWLRALAVILIVAAFCRPLWRQSIADDVTGGQDHTVILLDTSASMKRNGLWEEAVTRLAAIVEDTDPLDSVQIMGFDNEVTVVVSDEDWKQLEPSQRPVMVSKRVDSLSPSWQATDLGNALSLAADHLEQAATSEAGRSRSQIIVISDMQAGSRWESLQGTHWPDSVSVRLEPVDESAGPTNAGISLVGQPETGNPPVVRVRVSNSASAERESFQVGWKDPFAAAVSLAPTLLNAVDVYVPPGQTRVVRLVRPEGEFAPGVVGLTGDDHGFDNQCFVIWPERDEIRIAAFGPDAIDDRTGMRFFLDALFPDTPRRNVEVIDSPATLSAKDSESETVIDLAIVMGGLDPSDLTLIKQYISDGGSGAPGVPRCTNEPANLRPDGKQTCGNQRSNRHRLRHVERGRLQPSGLCST